MSMIDCKRHGFQGGERVSQRVADLVKNGHATTRLRRVTLIVDGIEFPGLIDTSETSDIEQSLKCVIGDSGDFEVFDESLVDTFLARFTAICIVCLREYAERCQLSI